MVDINYNAKEFSKDEIDKLLLIKNGSIGLFSRVYRLNDKECLKVFKQPKENYEMYDYIELTKHSLSSAVFPKELIKVDKAFCGYIMDYINGIMLQRITNLDYSYFLDAYYEYIKELLFETIEESFMVEDLHSENIMYDYETHKFKSIDCDAWIKVKRDPDIVLKKNYEKVMDPFIYAVKLEEYPVASINTDFIDYYESIREDLERRSKQKIKTVGEMKRYLVYDKIRGF